MKILIASSIYPDAVAQLSLRHNVVSAHGADEETLKMHIAGCDVLIFRSGVQITAEVMQAAPNLGLILRAGSGIDNIDLDYVYEKGIKLVRIPGPGAKAVAEMSFALMLGLARNVLKADRLLRQGHWAKHEMSGHLLQGKVLGIVGAGNIGTQVGRLANAWGMNVLGCIEFPSAESAARLSKSGIKLVPFPAVLASSDFITLHVPLKESTRNLINAENLARMKPGAFLVNLARGGVVNEAALYDSISSGHLAWAALDVHEHEGEGKISPLAELENVILTPHIGAGAIDSQKEIGEIIIENIDVFQAESIEQEFALEQEMVIPA
jgi:D-3-phosphoglycerate dehydrogenase